MTGFLAGIESSGSFFLMIFIAIVAIILLFKVTKKVAGLVIKVGLFALIVYLILEYTNL